MLGFLESASCVRRGPRCSAPRRPFLRGPEDRTGRAGAPPRRLFSPPWRACRFPSWALGPAHASLRPCGPAPKDIYGFAATSLIRDTRMMKKGDGSFSLRRECQASRATGPRQVFAELCHTVAAVVLCSACKADRRCDSLAHVPQFLFRTNNCHSLARSEITIDGFRIALGIDCLFTRRSASKRHSKRSHESGQDGAHIHVCVLQPLAPLCRRERPCFRSRHPRHLGPSLGLASGQRNLDFVSTKSRQNLMFALVHPRTLEMEAFARSNQPHAKPPLTRSKQSETNSRICLDLCYLFVAISNL